MVSRDVDDLDRRILAHLQSEARHTSSSDIASTLSVSASTVRNRIQQLEAAGVLRGYHADVDYERAGYQLFTLIVCTAPIPDRGELATAAAGVDGVVEVQEVMTGEANVLVQAVGVDGDDLTRIGEELDELGLQVSDEDLIRSTHRSSFSGFEETDES
ncbi:MULTISPECIES: Lrp/AsnC family transcriptional regulator [unclassified Haladaptatus]|uniref:Lrp/AsnC family transcriptional regulator n=1 Tax=unclassified Haladaptatus TaxID=2622732 RepID=UPI0023E81FE4|nr:MULTISPECIES: Lrp/AsnC family transcriptional regulator [unclassified Haladaptatus]